MCWIIDASAVDLPDPVMPVTSTSPRGRIAISSTTGGRLSSPIGLRLVRNGSQREGDRAALLIGVDAEAADARDAGGEVGFSILA